MQPEQPAKFGRDRRGREPVDIFEGADAARRLGDAQPLLGALALGDVDQQPGETHRVVVGIEMVLPAAMHPQGGAVGIDDPEFLGEELGTPENSCHGDPHPRAIRRMDRLEEGPARYARQRLLGIEAIQLGKPRIDMQPTGDNVPVPGAAGTGCGENRAHPAGVRVVDTFSHRSRRRGR
jgi:hypothetical protein